jgi:hypothetical protein
VPDAGADTPARFRRSTSSGSLLRQWTRHTTPVKLSRMPSYHRAPRRKDRLAATVMAAAFAALPAAAQEPAPDTAAAVEAAAVAPQPGGTRGFTVIGSPADDRARLDGLTGRAGPGFSLLRSATTNLRSLPGAGVRLDPVGPELRVRWNSDLPSALNEGGLWAARGVSTAVQGGFRLEAGPLLLVAAPRVSYVRNEDFEYLSAADPARSALLPPWRTSRFSADLPLRPGIDPVVILDPGQSTLAVRFGAVQAGLSTESQWWGPAMRNAIVLSNHAPGFPHGFVRTARPVSSPLGTVEARILAGTLTESPYFDFDDGNDRRAIGAVAATIRPSAEPNLTLGVARAIVSPRGTTQMVLSSFPRVLLARPAPDTLLEPQRRPAIQVLSLFGRWIFPADGLEVYGEWARHELPGSLRAFLVAPHHTQGYTIGAQWATGAAGAAGGMRLQAELTNLEQSATYRSAPRPSFYTSLAIPQGYTHRGRTLGAAIGPGASSQWLAADWIGAGSAVGAFANRIRWDNDAYYESPMGWTYHAHDVSVVLGVRGHRRTRLGDVAVEVGRETRYNYLFQNPTAWPGGADATDVSNLSLRLTITPEH